MDITRQLGTGNRVYGGQAVTTKMDGTELIFGTNPQTIEWGFRQGIPSITEFFKGNYMLSKKSERQEIRNILADYPEPQLHFFMNEAEDEFNGTKSEMWMRVQVIPNKDNDVFPLGDFDEVYVETDALDVLDALMGAVYNVDVFDKRLFRLTIFDGQRVFERHVNSSPNRYHVFGKKSITDLIAKANSFQDIMLKADVVPPYPSEQGQKMNRVRNAVARAIEEKIIQFD